MDQKKCAICNQSFTQTQRIVRINVECVKRGKDDGIDPDYWSDIIDWDTCEMMHLSCVVERFDHNYSFPYSEEVRRLPVEEITDKIEKARPILRAVS